MITSSYSQTNTDARQQRWTSFSAVLTALVTLVCIPRAAMAQAGSLDRTFGTGGIFVTQDTQSFDAVGNAIALQDDGRIVVGGEINSLAGVLRLNPNGTLDPSFGTAGLVTIPGGLGGVSR